MKQLTKDYVLKRLYCDLKSKLVEIEKKEKFLEKHKIYKEHEKIFNETFEKYEKETLVWIKKITEEANNISKMIIEIEELRTYD